MGEHPVIRVHRAVEGKPVLKTGTAAAADRDAQHQIALVFLGQHFRDPRYGTVAKADRGCTGVRVHKTLYHISG